MFNYYSSVYLTFLTLFAQLRLIKSHLAPFEQVSWWLICHFNIKVEFRLNFSLNCDFCDQISEIIQISKFLHFFMFWQQKSWWKNFLPVVTKRCLSEFSIKKLRKCFTHNYTWVNCHKISKRTFLNFQKAFKNRIFWSIYGVELTDLCYV